MPFFSGFTRRISGQNQAAYNKVQIEDTAGTDALGLVTASPATNTLLARIKDLLSLIVLAAGTNSIGGTKDNGPHWTSVFGVSDAAVTSADASGAAASVTDAPTSGQKIVLTDILVSVGTAMTVTIKEETSGKVRAILYMTANSTVQWTPRSKLKMAVADKKMQVQTSVAGNITVAAQYYSEA